MSKNKCQHQTSTKLRSSEPTSNKVLTKAELEHLRQKIDALVTKNPAKAAIILSNWINPKSETKKKAG